jgi:CRP-like cAMP-binding protein
MESERESPSIFRGFNEQQLQHLRPLFTLFFHPVGSHIFEQGQQADCFYILMEGDVAIRYKPDDGPELTVTHIRPEGVIGWSAAIGSPSYTSSAVCTRDSSILRVRRASLRQLVHADPSIGAELLARLAELIEERLHSNHPQLIALLEYGLSLELDQPAIAV